MSSDDEPISLLDVDFNVDDDPEILRAALDFIEACDHSDEASDDSSDDATLRSAASSPEPAQPQAETEAPKPRAATRNRRKEEILELRKLVAELEKQVAGTKRKLRVPETLPFAISSDGEDASTDVNVVWQQISRRQQQERQQAELENMKLRGMVMDQLKVARELTRVAKRRALLGDHTESIPFPDEIFASSSPPRYASADSESPLMVRIYPARPSIPTRIGMAALPEFESHVDVFQDAKAMEGTPVNEAWRRPAITQASRVEKSYATRLAWQTLLRQFLARRRDNFCHDRVEDGIEAAEKGRSVAVTNDSRLVYTKRFNDDSDELASPLWRPRALWQSPAALLSSLLAPSGSATINLRLFRLNKAEPSTETFDDDASSIARRGILSLRSCAPRSLDTWQRSSLRASSCF